ncbi:MAG: hypothetical protein ABH828_04225 [archaeon]
MLLIFFLILLTGCNVNDISIINDVKCPITNATLNEGSSMQSPFAVLPKEIADWKVEFNTPKCRMGTNQGEFPDHYYCGYSSGINSAKLHKTVLNQDGSIKEKLDLSYSVEFDKEGNFIKSNCLQIK